LARRLLVCACSTLLVACIAFMAERMAWNRIAPFPWAPLPLPLYYLLIPVALLALGSAAAGAALSRSRAARRLLLSCGLLGVPLAYLASLAYEPCARRQQPRELGDPGPRPPPSGAAAGHARQPRPAWPAVGFPIP
jgi:hypothetical protein